jgi:hypothetical protein
MTADMVTFRNKFIYAHLCYHGGPLTTDEAAMYPRLSERKLYELVTQGAVPCTKVPGPLACSARLSPLGDGRPDRASIARSRMLESAFLSPVHNRVPFNVTSGLEPPSIR